MPFLNVIQPGVGGRPRGAWCRAGSFGVRLYRVAVIVAIVWLLRRHEARVRAEGNRPIHIEEARSFFPAADHLEIDVSERMGLWVLDRHGEKIGYVLSTSPTSDKIIGYSGPTDTLVALTPNKAEPKVVGIKVRYSSDTKQHVADVVANEDFMGTWNGKTWDEVAGTDPRAAGIEGVSGASLTSMCIANGIRHRFEQSNLSAQAREKAAHEPIHFGASDLGLLAVIAVAMLFSFTRLRSRVWLRRSFQVVLIGYVGFVNGQILAQSLLAGWASTAVPWRAAPGLALLAAAALIVPWATRRQVYCSHICPHGAAQELIGRVRHRWIKRLPSLPRAFEHGLRWLPPMLIALVLFVTMLHVPFDLAGIEPFDAYLIRNAGAATIAVAVGGLIAAAFVPMAYCRFGCPTGMVLSFIRSHGKADGFGRRDVAAGIIVLGVIAMYFWYQPMHLRLIRR
jgi:NosR/NirI family nitrous oxide reductase transcriptional regulator